MLRLILTSPSGYAVTLVAFWAWLGATPVGAQAPAVRASPGVPVSGRVTLIESGRRGGSDVGQAVVWLDVAGLPAGEPRTAVVQTEGKEFRPRVTVVPVGSTVQFPNHDPFNHNVFSLSPEGPFDLGLFGRGQVRETRFNRPGLIRVFCNVHAQMAAFVVVRDGPHVAQPAADGSFVLSDVPPGRYRLHAWHERAGMAVTDLTVTPRGLRNVTIELDARGYKFTQHLNKFGQPYARGGARY